MERKHLCAVDQQRSQTSFQLELGHKSSSSKGVM